MATERTFANMLNQKQQGKKPILKEEKKPNLWAKMLKKG
jgi:formaldehyde-activating enzyme involved in methanogenesis